jgi:hypothetical protein
MIQTDDTDRRMIQTAETVVLLRGECEHIVYFADNTLDVERREETKKQEKIQKKRTIIVTNREKELKKK